MVLNVSFNIAFLKGIFFRTSYSLPYYLYLYPIYLIYFLLNQLLLLSAVSYCIDFCWYINYPIYVIYSLLNEILLLSAVSYCIGFCWYLTICWCYERLLHELINGISSCFLYIEKDIYFRRQEDGLFFRISLKSQRPSVFYQYFPDPKILWHSRLLVVEKFCNETGCFLIKFYLKLC